MCFRVPVLLCNGSFCAVFLQAPQILTFLQKMFVLGVLANMSTDLFLLLAWSTELVYNLSEGCSGQFRTFIAALPVRYSSTTCQVSQHFLSGNTALPVLYCSTTCQVLQHYLSGIAALPDWYCNITCLVLQQYLSGIAAILVWYCSNTCLVLQHYMSGIAALPVRYRRTTFSRRVCAANETTNSGRFYQNCALALLMMVFILVTALLPLVSHQPSQLQCAFHY